MLALMKRETDSAYIRDLLQRMRAGIPGVAIRTTFIVGFPGETEADLDELLEFIGQARSSAPVYFNTRRRKGTRAAKMDGHLHHMTRKARWNSAMQKLQSLAEEINRTQVGKVMRVLVEEPGVARTEWDAPEIDGTVYVDKMLPVGSFADVQIKDWRGYDLVAAR